MFFFLLSLILLFFRLSNGNLVASERNAILNFHNEKRCGRNVKPLSWSCALENGAQEIARTCPTRSSSTSWRAELFQKYGGVLGLSAARQFPGENIGHGRAGNFRPDQLAGVWFSTEEQTYVEECRSGSQCGFDRCGHYTLAMWSSSTRLGCAVQANCPASETFGVSTDVLVCLYFETGNFEGDAPFPLSECAGPGTCSSSVPNATVPQDCTGFHSEPGLPPTTNSQRQPSPSPADLVSVDTIFGPLSSQTVNIVIICAIAVVLVLFLCCVLACVSALSYRSRVEAASTSNNYSTAKEIGSTRRGGKSRHRGGQSQRSQRRAEGGSRRGRGYSSRRAGGGSVAMNRMDLANGQTIELSQREADTPPIIPNSLPQDTIDFDDNY